MRCAILLGLIGVGLAGCNGASGTANSADAQVHTYAGDSTGSHVHGRVGSAGAQAVGADAVYGASGLSGGANGNGGAKGQ